MAATKPLVISYIRFSTPAQLKGDSRRRQMELAENWCMANGLTLTDNLADLGISAYRGKNITEGALADFLDAVKAGKVPQGSYLLVEMLDRLSRAKVKKALYLFLGILNAGINIVTLSDGHVFSADNANELDIMYSIMGFAKAHQESDNKSTRLKAVWGNKKKQARDTNKPLGNRTPKWITLRDGTYVVVESEAKIIKRMFNLCIAGYGIYSITQQLKKENMVVNTSYVAKCLHNPAVIGHYQPQKLSYINGNKTSVNDGDVIKGYYPAIIDDATYYAARDRLAQRLVRRPDGKVIGINTGKKATWCNILHGLAVTDDGRKMVAVNKGAGAGRAYYPANVRQGEPVSGIQCDTLDVAVLAVLGAVGIDLNKKETSTIDQTEINGIDATIAQHRTRLAEIEEEAAKSNQPISLLVKAAAGLEKQIQALEAKKAEIYGKQTTDIKVDGAMAWLLARHPLTAFVDRLAVRTITGKVTSSIYQVGHKDGLINPTVRMEIREALRVLIRRVTVSGTQHDGMFYNKGITIDFVNGTNVSFNLMAHRRRNHSVLITFDADTLTPCIPPEPIRDCASVTTIYNSDSLATHIMAVLAPEQPRDTVIDTSYGVFVAGYAKDLHRQGTKVSTIAKLTGLCKSTVRGLAKRINQAD